MKKFFYFLFVFFIFYILFFISSKKVFGQGNNKFGIHLAQPHFNDLKTAAALVNSAGGEWGYITLVIQENDRNLQKWQEIFDQLRQLHLIPIIRLATVPEGGFWRRPRREEAKDWVDFLDSLNWVVKNRYVILFNEPNHGSEWGGEVDPFDYAQVAFEFAKRLKEKNADFFVMLAGFDASAPHQSPQYQDEEVFLRTVLEKDSPFINYIDGWASHSYPNPDFAGSPWGFGRGTVRTYQWELELLKRLGVRKDLPVFITETGWRRDTRYSILDMGNDWVAQNFKIAFEQVWLPDEQVMAVTPFVLDYQGEPFLGFSWKRFHSDDFYPQYKMIQSLPKVKGEPERVEKGEINFNLPKELVEQSTYQFKIKLKNLGQAIWDENENYKLQITNDKSQEKPSLFEYLFSDIKNIKPFEEQEVTLFVKTKDTHLKSGRIENETVRFILKKDEEKILESNPPSGEWQFKIIPLPSLKFKVKLFPKLAEKGDDFEVQIFDEGENVVFKKNKLKVILGEGRVDDVQNVIPGKKYRLVVLKPYYLPRQNFIVFKKGENKISFKSMIPLDFNQDGKFSFSDLKTLVKNPQLLKLFLP